MSGFIEALIFTGILMVTSFCVSHAIIIHDDPHAQATQPVIYESNTGRSYYKVCLEGVSYWHASGCGVFRHF